MSKKYFTLKQQIDCVKREIAMREKLYPDWVQAKRLKPEKAEYELNCMKAVLESLTSEASLEKETAKYLEEQGVLNQPSFFEEANAATV